MLASYCDLKIVRNNLAKTNQLVSEIVLFYKASFANSLIIYTYCIYSVQFSQI